MEEENENIFFVRQLKQLRSLFLPCSFALDQKWLPYPSLVLVTQAKVDRQQGTNVDFSAVQNSNYEKIW